MSTIASLDRIGVGIDTARYGHRVSFLRPDRKPAAKPLTVMEDRAGYQSLQDRLNQLHEQHPGARFHVRIDAAGQYAVNLELFLRGLKLPMTISVGEPKRNKDYQKAHFPKRTTDDTESQAMARFAVVELPDATPAPSMPMVVLREVAARLQSKVKQTTQAINRLHNLLARALPRARDPDRRHRRRLGAAAARQVSHRRTDRRGPASLPWRRSRISPPSRLRRSIRRPSNPWRRSAVSSPRRWSAIW